MVKVICEKAVSQPHIDGNPYTLQWTAPSPPQSKLPFLTGASETHNTWLLGPIRVYVPNGISIGSASFAGLTIVTDRPTDRQTDRATPSVTIGRIYVVLRCGLKIQIITIVSGLKYTEDLTYLEEG